jgi:hypothetical protein
LKIPSFESGMSRRQRMCKCTLTCQYLQPMRSTNPSPLLLSSFSRQLLAYSSGSFRADTSVASRALHLRASRAGGQGRAGKQEARLGLGNLVLSVGRGSSHLTTPQATPEVLHYQIHAYVEPAIGHCHLLPPPSGASTAPRLST